MPRILVALSALLAACGGSEPPRPDIATGPERFEVPVMSLLLYAEVRALELVPPESAEGATRVRAAIRICRADGSDAGTVFGVTQPGPGWTGVLSDRETEIEFDRLEAAPGIPAPLNVVILKVKASVDDAGQVTFDVHSTAICVR